MHNSTTWGKIYPPKSGKFGEPPENPRSKMDRSKGKVENCTYKNSFSPHLLGNRKVGAAEGSRGRPPQGGGTIAASIADCGRKSKSFPGLVHSKKKQPPPKKQKGSPAGMYILFVGETGVFPGFRRFPGIPGKFGDLEVVFAWGNHPISWNFGQMRSTDFGGQAVDQYPEDS